MTIGKPETAERAEQGLPPGWVWASLGSIVQRIKPGFPCGNHNKNNQDAAHLRPMNITTTGEISLADLKYVETANYEPLRAGDVLFNNTNSPALVGKTTYVRTDTNWAYSNHMTVIRLDQAVAHSGWVAHMLHHLFLTGYFQMNCTNHVNQASINSGFLTEQVRIPLPPLAEQEQIVAEVDRRLSVVAEIEASVEAQLKRAERLRQSILSQAFAGKLAPQDPSDEPAGVLLQRIQAERTSHTPRAADQAPTQLRLV